MADSADNTAPLFTNFSEENLGIIDNLDTTSIIDSLEDEFEDINETDIDELYTNVIDDLFNTKLTLDNYETIFRLKDYHAVELQPIQGGKIRNIKYKDHDGMTMAIVQIYTQTNKIKLHTFGNIFPKQEFTSPQDVLNRILVCAEWANWSTEYGGINQFDGNTETRYKNAEGLVMAAVISKNNGKSIDTIVEYQYKNGKKTGMLHTNQYGQSLTIYDSINELSQLMSVDIDTDGCICSLVRGYDKV